MLFLMTVAGRIVGWISLKDIKLQIITTSMQIHHTLFIKKYNPYTMTRWPPMQLKYPVMSPFLNEYMKTQFINVICQMCNSVSSNSSPYHSHKKLTWQFKALSYWQTTVPIHSFIHSAWAGTIGVLAFRRKQDLMPRVIWIQPLHERHHIVYQIINLPIKNLNSKLKEA